MILHKLGQDAGKGLARGITCHGSKSYLPDHCWCLLLCHTFLLQGQGKHK